MAKPIQINAEGDYVRVSRDAGNIAVLRYAVGEDVGEGLSLPSGAWTEIMEQIQGLLDASTTQNISEKKDKPETRIF